MGDGGNKPTIGIIAPYRAQVALLRRKLENEFDGSVDDNKIWIDVVDTVDRFQGDERDIIIISLCLRRGSKSIPRIYEDNRRINVALSRAKKKLWIIGCIEEMKRIPTLRAFKEYASNHLDTCLLVDSFDSFSSSEFQKNVF